MNLTGKCLMEFWDWYLKHDNQIIYKTASLNGGDNLKKIHFISLCEAEQFGVIQDFADAKKIVLDVKQDPIYKHYFTAVVENHVFGKLPGRNSARIKSVKEFDNYYNRPKK